jgi:predicted MFS family arabinose efflux permease
VGQSFISGSDSALLFDSLKREGKEKDYVKIEGRVLSIGNFAETLAAIAGGFLAEISLRTPFIAQTFVALIAIPAAFSLIEPQKRSLLENRWKAILNVLKHTLLKNKELQTLIIFTAFIGTATLTMAWFIQPYLKEVQHLSLSEIGISLSILNLIVGLTTLIAYKIESFLGKRKTLLLITFGISISYISMGNLSHWSIFLIIAFFYFVRGIATPVLKDYINRCTSSDIRATVLSIRNFSIRVVFAVAGPFFGWYSDQNSLLSALIMAGSIIFIGSVLSLIFYLMSNKKEHS